MENLIENVKLIQTSLRRRHKINPKKKTLKLVEKHAFQKLFLSKR